MEGGVTSSVACLIASEIARVSCREYVGAFIGVYVMVFTGSGADKSATNCVTPPLRVPPVATVATLEPSPVVGAGADNGFNPSFLAAKVSGVIGTFTLAAIEDCIAWDGVGVGVVLTGATTVVFG